MSTRVGRFPRVLPLSNTAECSDALYSVEFECVHKKGAGDKRRLRRINKDYFVDSGIVVETTTPDDLSSAQWGEVRSRLHRLKEITGSGVLKVLEIFEDYQYFYVVSEDFPAPNVPVAVPTVSSSSSSSSSNSAAVVDKDKDNSKEIEMKEMSSSAVGKESPFLVKGGGAR